MTGHTATVCCARLLPMTAARSRSRVLASVVAIALGLTLAACGSSSDDSGEASGGSPGGGTVQRGSDPGSEYCMVVLANLEDDVDPATAVEGQAEVAPSELEDAYEVLADHPDLLDAWETLDASQQEPIADELAEVVSYQVHVCGVDISGE